MSVRLAVLALLLLAHGAAWAGGPSPGVRRRCLGQCGNGVACVNQAATISSGCDFSQDDFGDEICPCTDAACTVTASGVFTGELTVSINEDCPEGVAGAHVTMHLAGR